MRRCLTRSAVALVPLLSVATSDADDAPSVTGANATVSVHWPPGGMEPSSQVLSTIKYAPSGSFWIDVSTTSIESDVGLVRVSVVSCRPTPTIVGEKSTPTGTKVASSSGPDGWNVTVVDPIGRLEPPGDPPPLLPVPGNDGRNGGDVVVGVTGWSGTVVRGNRRGRQGRRGRGRRCRGGRSDRRGGGGRRRWQPWSVARPRRPCGRTRVSPPETEDRRRVLRPPCCRTPPRPRWPTTPGRRPMVRSESSR